MKSVSMHRDEAYSSLSQDGMNIANFAKEYYSDYTSGMVFSVPTDLEYLLEEADEREKSEIRRYMFAENILNSAERIGEGFAGLYETHKHKPEYTLENYLLSWEGEFLNGENGKYADVLSNLIEFLEGDENLRGYSFGKDGRLNGKQGFTRWGLKAVLIDNSDNVCDLFLTALGEESRKRVEDIVYDKLLAQEAGESFLDMLPELRNDRRYTLQNFLLHYIPGKGMPRKQPGIYRPMFRRFVRRSKTDWKEPFYQILEGPVKSRALALDNELLERSGGVLFEEEIKLLESLATKGSLEYLLSLADEGSDAEDMFNALNLETLTSRESRVLKEILRKGKKKVREYLGVMRVRIPDSSVGYDWSAKIKEFAERVSPEEYARNDVLAAILYNKEREKWDQPFREDEQHTISLIEKEIESAENQVYNSLMSKVLAHYQMRKKVAKVQGMVSKLRVRSNS